MHWTPDAFWRATPHEVYAGIQALDAKSWLADDTPNLTQMLLREAESKDGNHHR